MEQILFIHNKIRCHFLIKKICVASLVLIIFLVNISFRNAPPKSKPNIILILLDDAGYADFGFMGCKDLQTPNIDALASQSQVFTDAHVSASVCGPSRAGLLTGVYQQRFGYECNEGDGYTGINPNQPIIAQLIKKQGYTTAAFGKWHLGYEKNQHPLNKGFDYYYGFLSGGRSYFFNEEKDDKKNSKTALLENFEQIKFDGYLTDVLGSKAAEFIEKNSHQPFFMYWAPNAVHTPMEASETDLQMFDKHPRKKLAAMTFALDRAIGTMVNALKKNKIYDNTVIIFLSDNGGAHNNQSSNLPLKGFKGNKYEGGHRVPFFISWPKLIKARTNFNGLTSSLDILPTVMAIAGNTKENFQTNGVNLLPYLQNKKTGSPHKQLFWRKDAAMSIRYKQYKLIQVKKLGDRLYDLEKDPGETTDLTTTLPNIYAQMKNKLNNWQKDKMQPIWREGAVWDTITLMIHDDLYNNRKVRVRNPEELQKHIQRIQ